ncbi:hypothetical protein [Nonomuraea jiangxiensis]|uniref:hypothetical protein n=1 Tax=Nonomuraea jiangxiensis TaxID=633440 RepID=UPI00115F82A6|nr:hypothetical protein [Nonomuraea jiangxiensis]
MFRWIPVAILLQYGFAKIFGAQFTILDSELDKPMGTVSGFWLTWYYFGYSPVFGTLIALAQIGLGIALAFRRTALLGAAGTVRLLGGIAVLNLSYGIAIDAMLIALIGAGCAAYVLWRHRRELTALFWKNGQDGAAPPPPRTRPRWVPAGVLALLLALAASCSFYTANYNNRAPTPLDGTWDVTAGSFRPPGLPGPAERVYFEHNRAFQAVLRSGQTWQTYHFEVDAATTTIRLWRTWLSKGEQLLSGTYSLGAGRLTIAGTDLVTGRPLVLELRTVPAHQLRPSP